jgi:hypothetical protein
MTTNNEPDATPGGADLLSAAEMRRTYDSLIASLQGLSSHLNERRSATALQELALRLGYFSLALNHQMDGDTGKAESALARADARASRLPSFFSSPKPLDGEDWTNLYH